MDWEMVSVSDAKIRFHELVASAATHPILLLRRSRPEAVLVSYAGWMELQHELEDARDRLALYRAQAAPQDLRISHEKLKADLGLATEDE
ncbi:MAG TPA: type II toxin-antitoxin system prevent-host-death family antitoxin [Actinomycetota bacterium]|jgi:prevent-host-death family protein